MHIGPITHAFQPATIAAFRIVLFRKIQHFIKTNSKNGRGKSQHRSQKQNNALHKYLRDLAAALESAGLDMRKVLKPEIDIPWTAESAKEHLWRPIQKIMTGQDSTTDPTTAEYVAIYECLDRHLSQKFGISVPWPAKDHD